MNTIIHCVSGHQRKMLPRSLPRADHDREGGSHPPPATRHSSLRLHYPRVRCETERRRDGMLAELMRLATRSHSPLLPSARRMVVDWWLLLWAKSRERKRKREREKAEGKYFRLFQRVRAYARLDDSRGPLHPLLTDKPGPLNLTCTCSTRRARDRTRRLRTSDSSDSGRFPARPSPLDR